MINGKYVNIDYILGEISDNYPFLVDVSRNKAKEFIWKIIGRLGIEDALYDDVAKIEIENYRGSLPSNLYDMTEGMVRDYDSKQQLTLITDMFYKSDDKVSSDNLDDINTTQEFDVCIPTEDDYGSNTYKISENHIFTGFKDGIVEMSYKAFPIDKYGNPLIPDDEKYISAVVSFIAERYAFTMMMTDKLSERKYDRIEQEYLFSASSARSSNKIPNLAKMNNIRNRFLSTNDGSGMFDDGFSGYGKKYN